LTTYNLLLLAIDTMELLISYYKNNQIDLYSFKRYSMLKFNFIVSYINILEDDDLNRANQIIESFNNSIFPQVSHTI